MLPGFASRILRGSSYSSAAQSLGWQSFFPSRWKPTLAGKSGLDRGFAIGLQQAAAPTQQPMGWFSAFPRVAARYKPSWQFDFGRIVPTAGSAATDPNFSSVVLLMGFEGSDGATGSPGMTDESTATNKGTATVLGNAQIDTAQFKYGASSLLLDGTGDSLTFADSADWAFGSGNFTIECHARWNSTTGTQFIVVQWQNTGNLSFALWQDAGTLKWNTSTTGSDNNADISAGSVSAGTWYHICIDYDGSKYRLYKDGTMTGSFSTPRTLFNSGNKLSIGSNNDNDTFWHNGWIDELRITKGVARYASDGGFTPPAAAYPRS